MMYTADQAAEALGLKPRRVRQIAVDLGIEKVGRDWVFTEAHLRKMRQRNTQLGPKPQRDTTPGPKPGKGRDQP